MECDFNPIDKEVISYHPTTDGTEFRQFKPYHRHDAYEIYLFIRGNVNFYIEHSCYHLEHGDLLVICPSEMHRCFSKNTQIYERIGINIKSSAIMRLSSENTDLQRCFDASVGKNKLIHLSEENVQHFIELSDHLSQAIESAEYGQDVLAYAYLSQILVFVNAMFQNSIYSTPNIMPPVVHETMTYVKEHISEKITLEQLSKRFYLDGTYISSQFKKHTGLSLRSYILDQRIAMAKELLSKGDNVSEACYRSGFYDYANFIRSFTKYVGVSPGKYRREN